MEIINNVNISDERLATIIKFCLPKDCHPNKITFNKSKTHFYGFFDSLTQNIRIGIGNCTFFPLWVTRRKCDIKRGYFSDFELPSKKIGILYLAAHEFRHSYQLSHPLEPRWGRDKSFFSESDADCYSMKMLRKYHVLKSIGKAPF